MLQLEVPDVVRSTYLRFGLGVYYRLTLSLWMSISLYTENQNDLTVWVVDFYSLSCISWQLFGMDKWLIDPPKNVHHFFPSRCPDDMKLQLDRLSCWGLIETEIFR